MDARAHTAVVSHPACGLHDTGWDHPEHQGRLPAIVKGIHGETPALLDRWLQEEAPAAGIEDLLRVHTDGHVALIRGAVERAASAGQPIALTADTMISGASWDAAVGAAGAAIHGARLVLEDQARTAFALTRPPGHHATASRAMGFCLFNNAAVATRWAQAEAGIARVLVVDWDVHHGNGTQEIFYDDPSVFYLSFHLSGHYPGTGWSEERGTGPGTGTTRNMPFPHGADRHRYLEVYGRTVAEVVADFDPGMIVVSAGFDCLSGDPLGGLPLEPEDLHGMTRQLMDGEAGERRVIVVLEGGYVPSRVADGAVQVIRALAGLGPAPTD